MKTIMTMVYDCETLFHEVDTIITTVKFTANTTGADHQLYGVYLINPNSL